MSWKSELINLVEVLGADQGANPRTRGLLAQFQSGISRLGFAMTTVGTLEAARDRAVTSALRSDYEFLLELARPFALYQSKQASANREGLSPVPVHRPLNDVYNPDSLRVKYIALNQEIALPGALATFDDTYRPTFRREEVYGRMDPIATYQGTKRNVVLEWEMNIASSFTPEANMSAFQDLIKFMYPVYQDTTYNRLGTGTLVSPPVLRINIESGGSSESSLLSGYNQGLLCIVDNFNFSRFAASAAGGAPNIKRALSGDYVSRVMPTHLMITLSLTVLHEEAKVGFVYSKDGDNPDVVIQFGQGEEYPYGFGTTVNLSDTPPAQLLAAESTLENIRGAFDTLGGRDAVALPGSYLSDTEMEALDVIDTHVLNSGGGN